MELHELQQAWQQYDRKLDRHIKLNQQVLQEINRNKAQSRLRNLLIIRAIESVFFLGVMLILGNFMAQHWEHPPLLLSALVLNIFTIIGFSGSIGQIILIFRLDYSQPILAIQKKLKQIEAHLIQNLRLLLLSIPFYLAYLLIGFRALWGVDLYTHGNPTWWIAQIAFSVALIPVALWLYRKIHFRNMHIAWVRSFIYGAGGQSVEKALRLLGDLEEFEQENSPAGTT